MVCSIEGGRMSTMARLLEGSVSQTVTEEVGRWTLAAQYVHRELIDADEANLLDEEDMHIFGLKPMTDPLNLVCCNSCKKPVKASQYTDHADRCKLLSCTQETTLEPDGGMGNKKPPRKERKKSLTAYSKAPVGEPERLGAADGENRGASENHLGKPPRVDGELATCVSAVNSGNPDFSAGVMRPPTKRSKSIAAESPLISDDIETASGITKSLCINTQEAFTHRGFLHGPRVGSQKTGDNRISGDSYTPSFPTQGTQVIPAPLATKIFYSQRNNRLRLALSQLYYRSSVNVQGHMMPSWTPMSGNFHHQQEESDKQLLVSMQNADQIVAHSLEVNIDSSESFPQTTNVSSQNHVNNALGSHRTPAGTVGSNYLSNPYSLAANSGNSIGRIQQSKGSVPVV